MAWITIGEVLEATVLMMGKKPVEWSDAATIQVVEVRATGCTKIVLGGVVVAVQSTTTLNARTHQSPPCSGSFPRLPFSFDPLSPNPNPLIIVISNSSGVNKDTLIVRLCEAFHGLNFVVTATLRPRPLPPKSTTKTTSSS